MTSEQYAINTLRLDDVDAIKRLLAAGRVVPVVKLDVQGFECRAIDGMLKLLQRANTLRVELADRWLRAHGCSPSEALLKMERLGFAVNAPTAKTTNAPPPCILRSRSGCDIVLSKTVPVAGNLWRQVPVAGNLCRWSWSGDAFAGQFCPTSWCAACASNPVCRAQCRLREHQWYGFG